MKKIYKAMTQTRLWVFTAALLLCGISMLTSCSNDDDNKNSPLSGLIIGRWMAVEYYNEPSLTDETVTLNFVSPTTCYIDMLLEDEAEEGGWLKDVPFDVTINGYTITLSGKISETISAIYEVQVTSIDDNILSCNLKTTDIVNGKASTIEYPARFARVKADYSNDIIGLWEGDYWEDEVTRIRMEYKTDGTYNFYFRNKGSGDWKQAHDDYSYYDCEGTMLFMRWKNVAQSPICEAWNITSINDKTMRWTALREKEDGSTYTVNVEFTKVPVNQ